MLATFNAGPISTCTRIALIWLKPWTNTTTIDVNMRNFLKCSPILIKTKWHGYYQSHECKALHQTQSIDKRNTNITMPWKPWYVCMEKLIYRPNYFFYQF